MTPLSEQLAPHGNLLIGISNPNTIPDLMSLAGMIVVETGYDAIATHIVTVPDQMSLGAARSSREVQAGSQLLRQAINVAQQEGFGARGVVEVAREVHTGLISAATTQHADLVLVGYSDIEGPDDKMERRFDRIMHKVARGTDADLIVAKIRQREVHEVLMPLLSGENLRISKMALQAVLRQTGASVQFVRAVTPDADREAQLADLHDVLVKYGMSELGDANVIVASDPQSAIIEHANDFDMTILGAERPTVLEALFGSMAERIASQAKCSVLLVRASHIR